MPATYEKIATTTLGSAGSISFTSIPATFTDIRLVLVAFASSNLNFNIEFNNDSTALYSQTDLYGNGTTASSGSQTGNNLISLTAYANFGTTPNLTTLDLFSYAGSTNKTCLITQSNDRNGTGFIGRTVALYRSTSAITRLDIDAGAPTFSAGTTATLYGILKA